MNTGPQTSFPPHAGLSSQCSSEASTPYFKLHFPKSLLYFFHFYGFRGRAENLRVFHSVFKDWVWLMLTSFDVPRQVYIVTNGKLSELIPVDRRPMHLSETTLLSLAGKLALSSLSVLHPQTKLSLALHFNLS